MPNLDPEQIRELALLTDPEGGFERFLFNWVNIQDQFYGTVKFARWPIHERVVEALGQHKLLVILKARQLGASWAIGAAYPLWTAMFAPNKRVLLFSRGEDEAGELITKIKYIHARLPTWMQVPFTKANALEVEFGSLDSEIHAFSSAKHSGTSYSASLVVSDEVAKQEYAEDQFASIRPTIDMGGQFIALSTANGPGTFHARVWHDARKGVNGFFPLFLPYNGRPQRDETWWETTKNTYPLEWQFFQEYPRNAEEAIQSSAPAVFPKGIELLAPDTPLHRDRLREMSEPDWGLLGKIIPRRGETGLRVYQLPVAGRNYAIGADVAEGDVSGDYQAAVVLDRDSGEEVACLHGHWAIPDYARYLVGLATVYSGALLAPEANNHGNSLILAIKREQIERLRRKAPCRFDLYHRKPILDAQGKVSRPGKPGFLTTKATKPVIIMDLKEALVENELRLASPAVLEEINLFQQNEDESYSAPSGYHDDLVMALAIANQMRLKPTKGARPNPRPYTIRREQEPEAEAVRLGAADTGLARLLVRMHRSPSPAPRRKYLKRNTFEKLPW